MMGVKTRNRGCSSAEEAAQGRVSVCRADEDHVSDQDPERSRWQPGLAYVHEGMAETGRRLANSLALQCLDAAIRTSLISGRYVR